MEGGRVGVEGREGKKEGSLKYNGYRCSNGLSYLQGLVKVLHVTEIIQEGLRGEKQATLYNVTVMCSCKLV